METTDQRKEWKKQWRARPENRAKENQANLARYYAHRDEVRLYYKARNNHMSEEQVIALASAQDHRCAVCGMEVDFLSSPIQLGKMVCRGCFMGMRKLLKVNVSVEAIRVYMHENTTWDMVKDIPKTVYHYAGVENGARLCRFYRDLQYRYGINRGQAEMIHKIQKGKCPVCGEEIKWPLYGQGVHLDHDHTTSVVRGILHGQCNQILGLFKHNLLAISKAVEFLTASVP